MSIFLSITPDKFKRWSSVLVTFLIGQVSLQGINLVSGFFLLRWLSKEDYAQYTLAFAFQSTAQMFVEFGFSGAIIALVGKQVKNKEVIGSYIKAGKFFRIRSFIIVSSICLIAFPLIGLKHNWGIVEIAIILIAIISNLFFTGHISYYKPVLQIHQKIKELYSVDLRVSITRLVILFVAYYVQIISGVFALLVNSVQTFFTGVFIKRKATSFLIEPKTSDIEKRKEMLAYITPIIPGVVFAAFQSQISLFIISYFGSTAAIAEMGALGRLGQIFLILNTSTGMFIIPFIAKQDRKNLLKKFIGIISAALLFCLLFISMSFFHLDIFIWFLGEKYAHLNDEIILTIINSCILFINGLVWGMNSSRKWLFKWMPMISIPGILLVQIVGAAYMDLSIVFNVIVFNIITSVFTLLTRINVSFWGFKSKI